MPSSGLFTTLRLHPGDDLKQYLVNLTKDNNWKAVTIVSCVGSLSSANLRLASASANTPSQYFLAHDEKFEIVSLVGTLESELIGTETETEAPTDSEYGHLHISIANGDGQVFGGHLMSTGNTIFTTAEITLLILPELQYTRVYDPATGYEELSVSSVHLSEAAADTSEGTIQGGGIVGVFRKLRCSLSRFTEAFSSAILGEKMF